MVGRWARIVLAVVLVLAGTGCDRGPHDPVSAALAATEDAGTARFELESVVEGFRQRDTTVTRAHGAVDFRNNRRRTFLEVQLLEGPAQLPAGVVEQGQILVDGTDRYVEDPAGDVEWVRYEDQVPVPTEGPPTGRDPVELLDGLRHVTGEIEETGEENVRGTPTTRYELVADLTAGDEERFGAHLTAVPGTVWLDADQRIRRLAYTIEVPEHEPADDGRGRPTGTVGTVTMTVELFGFGSDVDIVPPPADAVRPPEDAGPPDDGE